MKKGKVMHAVQNLKTSGPTTIDLDSSSALPKACRKVFQRTAATSQHPSEEDDHEDHCVPKVGEGSDVEAAEANSHVGGCSDKMVKHEYRDICGVNVLGWFVLPVQCHQHGPFSVTDLDSTLAPFGLQLGQFSGKTPAVDGKYLCHHKQDKQFTGVVCI